MCLESGRFSCRQGESSRSTGELGCDLAKADRQVGDAFDVHAAVGDFEIFFGGFKNMRGDAQCLVTHFDGGGLCR